MTPRRISFALAALLTLVAVFTGLRTGGKVLDTDEDVYQRTLRSMRAGQGYYRAMSEALVAKEHAQPDSIRAIRPPTEFLLLRWLPEKSLRWVVGLIYLAVLLGLARLGEPYGRYGSVVAVAAGGIWMIGASSYLYLHAELWGLPFFIGGLVAVRRNDDASAAALFAAATVIRELYGLGLLMGLVMAKRRRAWLVATGIVVALAGAHVVLARNVLAPSGHQVALGNEAITVRAILRFLSPGDRSFAFVLGIGMLLSGFVGIARNLQDRAARVLLPFAIFILPLGIVATRAYWNLTYGPAVSAFAASAFLRSVDNQSDAATALSDPS